MVSSANAHYDLTEHLISSHLLCKKINIKVDL